MHSQHNTNNVKCSTQYFVVQHIHALTNLRKEIVINDGRLLNDIVCIRDLARFRGAAVAALGGRRILIQRC